MTNPGELKSENVISIKRDENSGKMMGAVFIFARSHLVDVHSLKFKSRERPQE
jgi:hypothetical protein